jgi:hypothetical protein
MSDRYNYLTVVLEHDLRDDDAQSLIQAIYQLRGVLKVEPNVSDAIAFLAQARAKEQLRNALEALL